jgi:hypothetical protein
MTSTITAKPTSVWCHPTVSMSTLAVGRNRNCPSEPAAVLAPNAMGRQLSGRSLPKTLMTRLPEQPDRPKPTSTPAPRWTSTGVVPYAMRTRPSA